MTTILAPTRLLQDHPNELCLRWIDKWRSWTMWKRQRTTERNQKKDICNNQNHNMNGCEHVSWKFLAPQKVRGVGGAHVEDRVHILSRVHLHCSTQLGIIPKSASQQTGALRPRDNMKPAVFHRDWAPTTSTTWTSQSEACVPRAMAAPNWHWNPRKLWPATKSRC